MAEYIRTYLETSTVIDVGLLHSQINANVTITAVCNGITFHPPDKLNIEFDSTLSGGEETALDTTIAAHAP